MKTCLLCHSSNLKEIAKVDSKKIVRMYLKTFKSDFSYLFSEQQVRLLECDNCGLRFYDPQVAGDEQFYRSLQKFDWYYRRDKEEYEVAAGYIKPNDRVLDVGCGQGEFKKYVPGASFTGLEFSSDAISKGTANGCHILNESIEDHSKINAGKYDVVATFQVLEHVTKIADFVKSCAECVKPGGYLIIAVPSEESYLRFGTNSLLNMPPHHISRWQDKTLASVAKLINFQVREIRHDNLDDIHKESYFAALVERVLPFRNSKSTALINESLGYKMRMNIAYRMGKKIRRLFDHPAWYPKGQNVTVVYQKPRC
jgi:2-polyprenyl-3-methyl-5-hydroxy-6-metoxy-1,4-benzoquinol methylase